MREEGERRRVESDIEKALAALTANPGIRPLTRAESIQVRDYARDTFRSPVYGAWLRFYATFLGGATPVDRITENFFQEVAVQRINGRFHDLCQARTLQWSLLRSASMPDLLHRVSGAWRDLTGEPVARERVAALLFADQESVFVKLEETFKGRGVTRVRRADFDIDAIEAMGNLVIQRPVRQSRFFDAIYDGATATIRVNTGKLQGEAPWSLGSILRIAGGGEDACNERGLWMPVSDEGVIGRCAWDYRWRRHERHPSSGFRFEGARVPDLRKAVAHCLEMHERLAQFGLIGWDVAIDEDGSVQIMEFNTGHPGIMFIELVFGPTLLPFRLDRFANERY